MSPAASAHRPIEQQTRKEPKVAHASLTPTPAVAPASSARAILALDLGTTTGWALPSVDGLVTSGTVSFRPSRYDGGGMRYVRFRAWLERLAPTPRPSRPSTSRRCAGMSARTRPTSSAASSRA
jgi:hypothetical protein